MTLKQLIVNSCNSYIYTKNKNYNMQ